MVSTPDKEQALITELLQFKYDPEAFARYTRSRGA
jgi:hypothetical protein